MNGTPAFVSLVAHRGNATRFPENTLPAFDSAARLGLRHVELDIQLTADCEPLVLHDATLDRTHGLSITVTHTTLRDLTALGVLVGGWRTPAIPRLRQFTEWLTTNSSVHAFVELKKESLGAHGRRTVLTAISRWLSPLGDQVTLISYDAPVLEFACEDFSIGYVVPGMTRRARNTAERLKPGILLADRRHLLRAGNLWPGPWRWAAFEVARPALAPPLVELGVEYLETMDPEALLAAGIVENG